MARVMAEAQPQRPADPLLRLQHSLDRLYKHAAHSPASIAMGDRQYESLAGLLTCGVGGYSEHSRYKFHGIDIVGHLGVEPGVVVACDEKGKMLGAFAWSPQ